MSVSLFISTNYKSKMCCVCSCYIVKFITSLGNILPALYFDLLKQFTRPYEELGLPVTTYGEKKLHHLSLILKHEFGLNDFHKFGHNNIESNDVIIPAIMQKAKKENSIAISGPKGEKF